MSYPDKILKEIVSNDESKFLKLLLLIFAIFLPTSILIIYYPSLQTAETIKQIAIFFIFTTMLFIVSLSYEFSIAEIYKKMNIKINQILEEAREYILSFSQKNKNSDAEKTLSLIKKGIHQNNKDIKKYDHPERQFISSVSSNILNIQILFVLIFPFIKDSSIIKNIDFMGFIVIEIFLFSIINAIGWIYHKSRVKIYLFKIERQWKKAKK